MSLKYQQQCIRLTESAAITHKVALTSSTAHRITIHVICKNQFTNTFLLYFYIQSLHNLGNRLWGNLTDR